MNNNDLAHKIFNALFDDEDLNEMRNIGFIAQPLGYQISSVATIEVELDSNHDRMTEEIAKLRHELANLIYMAENNTGNEPSLSCLHLAIDEAKHLLNSQLTEKLNQEGER